MLRFFPFILVSLSCFAFLVCPPAPCQDKGTQSNNLKDEPKKLKIPIDPTPKITYRYSPSAVFGITAVRLPGATGKKKLTFDEGGLTNTTLVKIDGSVLEVGGPAGRLVNNLHFKKGASGKMLLSEATWAFQPKVYLTQALDIVPNQQPVEVAEGIFKSFLDTCLVKYVLENRDTNPHYVGLRLEIDTLIGGNDGVPFTIPGQSGLVDKQADFPDADKIPEFFQALEHHNLQSPGTVAHISLKVGRGIEPPGRVSLTHWTANSKDWDVPLRDMDRDSSVILYWEEKKLEPKEKRVVGFAYGLGAIASQSGNLGLTVSGVFEKGSSFTVVATVTKPTPGLNLTLVLPPELERVDGKEKEPVPMAAAQGTSLVTWRVQANKKGQFKLTVRGSDGMNAVQTITITEAPPIP